MTSLSALLFGLIPLLSKQVYAAGLDAVSLSFYRYLLPLPLLYTLLKHQHQTLRCEQKDCKNILIISFFGNTLTTLSLNLSYVYLAVGTATTLHFLYPLFVALLCVIAYKEKLGQLRIVALLVAFFGIFLFLNFQSMQNLQGILLAITSGLTYAFYMVSMDKKKLNRLSPYVVTFYSSCVVCLSMLILNIFTHSLFFPTSIEIWLILLAIAFFCQIVAVSFLQLGIRYLGATSASLFCLFEPLTSIITGTLFLQEALTWNKLLGCVFIFSAVLLLLKGNRK